MADDGLDLSGRVAVVTGAGRGLGRAEALALAQAGARVVVNDLGGPGENPAEDVVAQIRDGGGEAVAHDGDVSEWAVAEALVASAVSTFGGLDVLVNNAGILRDRMIFNISEAEWDAVIRVHLKGHAACSHAATAHWRARSKEAGGPVYARVVNTASEAFLFGSEGQPNYGAAKAGIATLTTSIARSCARYGVRANVICPRARTQMTAEVFGPAPAEGLDPLSVEHVAPLVAYLASPAAERINGQLFVVYGGMVALVAPPTLEKRFDASAAQWSLADLHGSVGSYFADREPARMFVATELASLA